MSASPPIIGPESDVGGPGGGPRIGPSGLSSSGFSGGPQQTHVNVKESTLVISNSSTCTLKLQSTGGPFKKAQPSLSSTTSYSVQFNKETTTKTTSSEVSLASIVTITRFLGPSRAFYELLHLEDLTE